MASGDGIGEAVPTHAFPLTGPLPSDLEPPAKCGPVQRLLWDRAVRRNEVLMRTGPGTSLLNMWLAAALDRGCDGLRFVIAKAPPVDPQERLRELEEKYQDWPHMLEVKRAQAARPQTARDLKLAEFRWVLQVLQRLPSGEWEHAFGPAPTFGDSTVREVMSLAPAGRCVLTRPDGLAPLLVSMRRLTGEHDGLDLTWEEATP